MPLPPPLAKIELRTDMGGITGYYCAIAIKTFLHNFYFAAYLNTKSQLCWLVWYSVVWQNTALFNVLLRAAEFRKNPNFLQNCRLSSTCSWYSSGQRIAIWSELSAKVISWWLTWWFSMGGLSQAPTFKGTKCHPEVWIPQNTRSHDAKKKHCWMPSMRSLARDAYNLW